MSSFYFAITQLKPFASYLFLPTCILYEKQTNWFNQFHQLCGPHTYLHFHREFLCSNQLSVQKTAQASSINNNTITHVYQSKVCVYCRILFERNGEYIYYKALDACIRCKNDCHFGSNGIFQFLVKWCGNASNIYSVRNACDMDTQHMPCYGYSVFVCVCGGMPP